MIAYGLENEVMGQGIVVNPGMQFRIITLISLTAGTAFIMWLGEQISERGIGNGISLIIFSGIVARMPLGVIKTFREMQAGQLNVFSLLILVAIMVGVIGVIIWAERAQRRIPVQHAKRIVGRKVYGGANTHLPLKLNTAGVIPPIFASSILMFPSTIANFINIPWVKAAADQMNPGKLAYEIVYVVLILFFCYFYTAVTFNPIDVAENLKKQGGYIPGIRPGKKTAHYIDRVLTRVTFGGAIYVAAICVLPTVLITKFNVSFYFGGTALLIVVGVALDTIQQVESHMLTRHYDGFLGSGMKFKGRNKKR
jgi:preprotein translocase subunit SecY